MTEEEQQLQIAIGARVWIEAARIMWLRIYPGRPCPIGEYDDINNEGRMFMYNVMTRVFSITNDMDKMKEIEERFAKDGLIL